MKKMTKIFVGIALAALAGFGIAKTIPFTLEAPIDIPRDL